MTDVLQSADESIVLPDGRRLAFAQSGAPDGQPVLAFHGLPGSRLQRHPDPAIARAAGVRLVHVDRPGFGRSDPRPGRTLADWPGDVAALADALGFSEFALVGVSGGGPFALACAAALGERVRRVALVSSVGPPEAMRRPRALATPAGLAFALALRAPWVLRGPLALGARVARRRPRLALRAIAARAAPADRAIIARPDVQAMLAADLGEAFRQGAGAFAHEIALLARPWGVALATVRCPVAMWHGEDDRVVLPDAARALAARLTLAHAAFVPREGHFMVLERLPEILAWVAAFDRA